MGCITLFLINSLLNLIEEMRISFIQFYIVINDIELYSNPNNFYKDEQLYFYTGYISSIVTLYAGAVFIKANSILDILTKIMFEIKNKETDFLTYKKLNSHNKQYGDINRLDLKQIENTLFEKTKFITEIISIRNEIIHNGSWDFNPKIFFNIKSNKIIERFMLFPDMEDGHLASFKNRNHFFSEQNKLNLKLDYYYSNFMKLLLNTIKYMLQ